ncbi:Methyltransferase domain-containing protein [Mariniphaga anaerophila]|uniref:Methyltransferase domain-containing protein n=1 Tax=Mariniphaga anaerophila TaxID=1484053 RepID=A0A1M5AS57_9BACT|nr:class I SAM-dependent methyltransferase [Mariniphaga anaerophila]SHF33045.1 Methyltransferase domain-containing protein [Mariniphaga anaerophila]
MSSIQNKFYSSVSKYYSEIFPFNPLQLQFVKSAVGELAEKRILDIGCATGELASQLATAGANVTGIDLNEDLLRQAVLNKKYSGAKFQKGNMINLKDDFENCVFDAVLCFGNTLVHLPSEEAVLKMLRGVCAVLRPGGKFLLQILNYDYILAGQVSELPVVESEKIRFLRRYVFDGSSSLVRFQTELQLKKEKQLISNEVPLYALKSAELFNLMKDAGFGEIQLFSNFQEEAFGGKHLPLVAKAVKNTIP